GKDRASHWHARARIRSAVCAGRGGCFHQSISLNSLRKFLLLVLTLPIVAALGWWYFHERSLPDYGPAYREYAYITNGKSNTVSVIDLRTFQPAKTIQVGSEPVGIAANNKKNEI